MARLEVLSESDCLALLREVPVGWLAHCTGDEVHMVTVNFTATADEVVIHVGYGTKLGAAVHGRPMTLGAGAFDEATQTGWSVTVAGAAHLIGDQLVNPDLAPAAPWAELERTVPIGLPLTNVNGRRLRS